MQRRKTFWALAVAGTLAMSGMAACGGDDNNDSGSSGGGGGSKPKVAVLLPDSKSSVRWETVDRPLLQKALETGGIEANITNAEGDKSTQQQQAEQAITNGAKVILLVNLDSGSGAAIASNAKSQGVKVIDYDRLTLDTDAQRLLRVVRQREGRQAPGRGPRQVPGQQAGCSYRRAERLADGQQRDAVQERVRLGAEAEVRVGRLREGRRSVGAGLGQPEGADDLRADAAEVEQQDRRRARGQ